MKLNPLKLLEKCPEDLEQDYKDIMHTSRMFLRRIDIDSTDSTEEIKIDIEEAKDELLGILANFVTTLNVRNTNDEKDNDDVLMMRFKFEQDMGEVISSLRDKHIYDIGGEIQLNSLLKGAGNLKVVFDLIIYQPIIRANNETFEELKDYILYTFALVSSNTSILGFSERASKVRGQIPKSSKPIYNKILESLARKKNKPPEEPSEEPSEEEGSEEEEEKEEEEGGVEE